MYELSTAAKRSQQILDKKYIDLLADKGYHNGVELAYAERNHELTFSKNNFKKAYKVKRYGTEKCSGEWIILCSKAKKRSSPSTG